MAPGASDRDIIISIRPQHVANIVSRVKNHEFRNYLLPPVRRLWIYETSPASSIRYVATISHGKRPGEIKDPSGLRNNEFDRGDMAGLAEYGYEIRKLEELPRSCSLQDLKRNGWLNGPPQKYCFIKPEMDKALRADQWRVVFDLAAETASRPQEQKGSCEEPEKDGQGRAPPPLKGTQRRPNLNPSRRHSSGTRKPKKPRAHIGGRLASTLEHWLEGHD